MFLIIFTKIISSFIQSTKDKNLYVILKLKIIIFDFRFVLVTRYTQKKKRIQEEFVKKDCKFVYSSKLCYK